MGEEDLDTKIPAVLVIRLLFENIARFFRLPKEFAHNCDSRITALFWF